MNLTTSPGLSHPNVQTSKKTAATGNTASPVAGRKSRYAYFDGLSIVRTRVTQKASSSSDRTPSAQIFCIQSDAGKSSKVSKAPCDTAFEDAANGLSVNDARSSHPGR